MNCRSTSIALRTVSRLRARALALAAILALSLGFHATCAAQTSPYNSLELVWTASGDDADVGQVSAYEVRYSRTPAGSDIGVWWNGIPTSQSMTLVSSLVPAGQTQLATVAGLAQGTTYYFALIALDEVANRSDYSNIATGTTQSCGAPSETPGAFAAVADTGQVLVSWTPATDPAALSLQLYRATGSGGAWGLLQSLSPTSSSYLDTAVQPGVTYRYRAAWAAAAVSGVACEGPMSPTATVTLPGTPGGGSTSPVATAVHAYPNPSSGAVNVSINVAGGGARAVRLRLFDMNGRWIATVADGEYPAGSTLVTWNREGRDGRRVAPGYYELLGTVGGLRVRERILLLP